MQRLTWLSYPLAMDDPRPPAIPQPSLTSVYTIERDGANVMSLKVANHTGTHADAPRHVIASGICITEFLPQELIFTSPCVVDLPLGDREIVSPRQLEPHADRMYGADLVLFRFGFAAVRRSDPARYSSQCPGFGVQSARWLRAQLPSLRAIGMDVPSLACIAFLEETMASHHELLGGAGRRFLVIEDMNLEHNLEGLVEVRVNPWQVTGFDSAPCSATGVLRTTT